MKSLVMLPKPLVAVAHSFVPPDEVVLIIGIDDEQGDALAIDSAGKFIAMPITDLTVIDPRVAMAFSETERWAGS